VLALALLLCTPLTLAAAKKSRGGTERKASRMIDKAVELLEEKQEERGIKMLSQVPKMYPETRARFRASLVLGRYQVEKRRYEQAIRNFSFVLKSEDKNEKAEALYRTGICHFSMNDYEQAFMALRRVTNEYPWSVFANESFYYIGQCHFKLKRWAKAVEALKMVGTSVPDQVDELRFAEVGQRLYVRVRDEDLVVLLGKKSTFTVALAAKSGDRETLPMEALGRDGKTYIGSLPTLLGKAVPNDGKLQVQGGEEVTLTYLDENTEDNRRKLKVDARLLMVSTASLTFTDGAYQEMVEAVQARQPAYVQLKDMDLDTTPGPDKATVKVIVRTKVKKEIDLDREGVDLDDEEEEEWEERTRMDLTLTETEGHSGVFRGSLFARVEGEEAQSGAAKDDDSTVGIAVKSGDLLELNYLDARHVRGEEEQDVIARAPVVLGALPDVVSPEYRVNEPALKAKKLLIEAKIFLQWSRIFRDVGLIGKAGNKSDQGLQRTEEVMRTYAKVSFDRALIEDAFRVKWELLLVQERLSEAIGVCRQLIRIFPDTVLADQAFLQIGLAKLEGETPSESVPVFSQILSLPVSSAKAEAQYNIGVAYEKVAIEAARKRNDGTKPNLSRAMLAYKKCADTYPDSKFAGQSLSKIINYYVISRDYRRAIETVQIILQDYEDAKWLDEVLLKGAIAAYRVKDYPLAVKWFTQIQEEYTSGKAAAKADKYLKVVRKKVGKQ
jgi:TolA-binding protein